MITRQRVLRQGRVAFAKPATPSWRRALASAVEKHTSSLPRADSDSLGLPAASPHQPTYKETRRTGPEYDPTYGRFREDYYEWQDFKHKINKKGASLTPFYQPWKQISFPSEPKDVTLEALMAAQSHFGHATGLWHPANARYIYGIRSGIHIISLDVTASHLRRAAKIVEATASMGGLILFVGTRSGQARSVIRAAGLSRGCHLFDRWIPGSITNAHQILSRCAMVVRDQNDEVVRGYEPQLMTRPALKPDLVVVLNPLENHVLLRECRLHHIPTIGIVDTDCDPTLVTYPIPANDDSLRCTNFIAGILGKAGEAGVSAWQKHVDRFGKYPKTQYHMLVPPSQAGGGGGGQDGEVRDKEEEGREEGGTEVEAYQSESGNPPDGSNVYDPGHVKRLIGGMDPKVVYQIDAVHRYAGIPSNYPSDPMEALSRMTQRQTARQRAERVKTLGRSRKNDRPSPALAWLVAEKRRAMGEALSEEDKVILKHIEAGEERARKMTMEYVEMMKQNLDKKIATHLEEVTKYKGEQARESMAKSNAEGMQRLRDETSSRMASREDDRAQIGPVQRTRRRFPAR